MAMDEQITSSLPALTAWQTESLRLTLFHRIDAEVEHSTWWSELVGEPPETQTSLTRMQGHRDEGPVKGGKLILGIQPGRIDWQHIIDPGNTSSIDIHPTLGNFAEAVEKFAGLMLHWLKAASYPSADRLAFGAGLVQQAENGQVGLSQLSEYLSGVDVDTAGSSDLLYQINRPRDTRTDIANLRINRLSRWSVQAFVWLQGRFSANPPAMEQIPGPEGVSCRLTLDVNTVPNRAIELTPELLPAVFEELVDLGKEIAEKGDIP